MLATHRTITASHIGLYLAVFSVTIHTKCICRLTVALTSLGTFLTEAQAVTHKRCAVPLAFGERNGRFGWKATSDFSGPSAREISPDKNVQIWNGILNHRLWQRRLCEKAICFSNREIVLWSVNPNMGNAFAQGYVTLLRPMTIVRSYNITASLSYLPLTHWLKSWSQLSPH